MFVIEVLRIFQQWFLALLQVVLTRLNAITYCAYGVEQNGASRAH